MINTCPLGTPYPLRSSTYIRKPVWLPNTQKKKPICTPCDIYTYVFDVYNYDPSLKSTIDIINPIDKVYPIKSTHVPHIYIPPVSH